MCDKLAREEQQHHHLRLRRQRDRCEAYIAAAAEKRLVGLRTHSPLGEDQSLKPRTPQHLNRKIPHRMAQTQEPLRRVVGNDGKTFVDQT